MLVVTTFCLILHHLPISHKTKAESKVSLRDELSSVTPAQEKWDQLFSQTVH